MSSASDSPLPDEPLDVGAETGLPPLGFHVITGEMLLRYLRRAAYGESPDLIYAEHWANYGSISIERGDEDEDDDEDE